MNLLLSIISNILVYGLVVLLEKYFKKEGLFVWISIAIIIANILVCKNIDIFGVTTTLGNIMFSSVFLASDSLNLKYSKNESYKAISLGLIMNIIFTITFQIAIKFIPSNSDIINETMKKLFAINLKTSLASTTMFFLSSLLDIYLFSKLKDKNLFLRSNISTIIANCLENYFFVFFAFLGIYSFNNILIIATTTSIIEIILSLCSSPFIYLIKSNK